MQAKAGKPVRIAYFSDAPWVGGAERYLYLLAANLPRGGFEPCLIVNGGARLETLARWAREAGIPVHEASLRLPSSLRGAGGFMKKLRRLGIEILHCNMPGPWDSQYGLVAPLARLAGVRRVVSTEHLPMVRPFLKGAALKGFGLAFIDRVITVSADNVRYLEEHHRVPRSKTRVVRIGIPDTPPIDAAASRRGLELAPGDFVCLVAASMEERKGHRFALDALSRLPERVKLIVAGSGGLEETLRRRSSELGLDARVRFLGFRSDVPRLLAACDALLVPSLLEATPYVIVEAMASARPVVASRIFGVPELVAERETGLLVDPGDASGLAEAIGALAGDRDLAARMGSAGRKRYEDAFRIERHVDETVAVYRELIGDR